MAGWCSNLCGQCATIGAAASVALAALFYSPVSAAQTYLLRISTENTPSHVQTRALARFAERVEAASDGQIDVEFYHSARLFRDRDVIAALAAGKVEMAVPGTWQLDRYVPDIGVYMLPLFYGLSAAEQHRVRDGELGIEISRRIESDLSVHVPGRWLDLGHAQLYFSEQQVRSHEDLQGLRIRIPGGIANQERLEAFGAEAKVIAWPDLPQALRDKRLDGMLSTHETVRSAALWESGIRYVFEDREYFAQYVPLLGGRFWNGLPDDLKTVVDQAWEGVVDQEREDAIAAQNAARRELEVNGISIVVPDQAALAQWRAIARRKEAGIVAQVGIDPQLVTQAEKTLDH
ncbi:TRAP transporter substrate-binding protein DctP [Marinobacterium lutimaris]|uniref:C4-dicarboxylate-binding protein DctP n=1 Tax=Marinobacterium lutimaris TaxID=568106 RepID=A0A1H5UXG6_9GAMM|nr:TRAP transporter substrate-binding protein DctP [Marinobacterium lutimaris]SEF79664.1 C4-dicarboxylate-binding protein DctP [Marinobacterium lutimaris]